MKLVIEINEDLDEESTATVLEEVARALREEELNELMDGSCRIETTHGAAFFSYDQDDD